jgi:predicted permease
MAALPDGAGRFLLVFVVAFVVLGCVPEGIPANVRFGPLLFPIARQVGVDEVHCAMVVVLVAALPSASNVPMLAERFGADAGRIARVVFFSTVGAFVSFTAAVTCPGAAGAAVAVLPATH